MKDVKEKSKLTLKEKRALKKVDQKKSEARAAKPTAVEKKNLKIEKAEAEFLAAAVRLAEMKTSVKKRRVENRVDEILDITALKVEQERRCEDVPPQISDTRSPESPPKELETTVKTCRVCSKSKSIEQFSKDKAAKDGLDSVCKSCGKEYRSPVAKAARARLKARKQKKLEKQNNK